MHATATHHPLLTPHQGPPAGMDVSIFNTFVHPLAMQSVQQVLASTFLSEGALVKQFEAKLASDFGLANPVALNSGTTALHLALEVAGIAAGDEVILPAQTFVATGLVIVQQRAVPVFADIEYETGNICVKSIEQKITPRTRAIMPVHWGGYPCDMDSIERVARQHNLIVIEDAAHALGAHYKGRPAGSLSDYTCFSFQAIKHLTTGDGGALACRDPQRASDALVKRWFGIDRANAAPSILGERQYDISSLGYKYHLNDYAAALGLANMQGYFERLATRIQFANRYREELHGVPGLQLFASCGDRQSAYWLFGMHVENRENFIRALKSHGITASVVHQRIDRNSIFGGPRGDLVNQARFDETQVHIPLHDAMGEREVDHVINTIKRGW